MSSVSVTGVAALRALAHPARLDLLDLLRVHDRLTAAECARLLGTSTKSCSYHLGVLARQGLVARVAEPGGDGRERPWRRAADEFDLPPGSAARTDQQAVAAAMQVIVQRDQELFARFLDSELARPGEWSAAVTVHMRTAVMGADQLREWGQAVEAVTRQHVERARRRPSAGRRPVRLAIRGFPQEPAAGAPAAGAPAGG